MNDDREQEVDNPTKSAFGIVKILNDGAFTKNWSITLAKILKEPLIFESERINHKFHRCKHEHIDGQQQNEVHQIRQAAVHDLD